MPCQWMRMHSRSTSRCQLMHTWLAVDRRSLTNKPFAKWNLIQPSKVCRLASKQKNLPWIQLPQCEKDGNDRLLGKITPGPHQLHSPQTFPLRRAIGHYHWPRTCLWAWPLPKTAQLEAMANGNMFIPQVPLFKLYKTHISYGRDKMRVKTDIFRIKCSIDKAWLLKEFFAQLSNPMELDTRIGTFVPTRAVHLLGLEMYTNLTCDHNSFLQSIATVPVGNFQHNTLDIPFSCDSSNNIKQTTINNLILDQLWCLNIECTTTPNKVLIVTTKGQLAAACEWINNSLPALYTQHVDDKIDVTTLKHLTPRHLDNPTSHWPHGHMQKSSSNAPTTPHQHNRWVNLTNHRKLATPNTPNSHSNQPQPQPHQSNKTWLQPKINQPLHSNQCCKPPTQLPLIIKQN